MQKELLEVRQDLLMASEVVPGDHLMETAELQPVRQETRAKLA